MNQKPRINPTSGIDTRLEFLRTLIRENRVHEYESLIYKTPSEEIRLLLSKKEHVSRMKERGVKF